MPSAFPVNDVRNGDEKAITTWQNSHGDINHPFEFEDWTPLHLFAAEGNENAVKLLLKCGARTDELSHGVLAGIPGQSPLHIASRYGFSAVVAALIRSGADIDLIDSHGFSPLHYAAVHGHMSTVKKLIELGANSRWSSNGGNNQNYSSVDANVVDIAEGFTAADLAQASGHGNVAAFLRGLQLSSSAQEQAKLKGWLQDLGCSAYYSKFVDNGYDFGFIEAHGLDNDDVDGLGIPEEKLGLRKKLLALYKFPYSPKPAEEVENDADDAEEEDDDDDSEGEESGDSEGGDGSDSGSDESNE